MTPETAEALANFTGAYKRLEEIDAYLRSTNGVPEPGSPLDVDDKLFKHNPASNVVRMAMLAASDHLDLVRQIVSLAPKKTFLTASHSVARGALIGAAQALWIVGPDKPDDRQQRALSVAIEAMSSRIGYQVEQLKVCSAEQAVLSRAQIETVLKVELKEAMKRRKTGHNATVSDMIKKAVPYALKDENVAAAVTSVDLLWRQLGGDAHALGWQLMLSPVEFAPGGDPEAPSEAWVTGDLEWLLQASLWAAKLLSTAVSRVQKLSSVP